MNWLRRLWNWLIGKKPAPLAKVTPEKGKVEPKEKRKDNPYRPSNLRRALNRIKAKQEKRGSTSFGTFQRYRHITVKPFGRIQKTGAEKFKERA